MRLLFLGITVTLGLAGAQLPVTLNSAGNFTVLGFSTVTNTGPSIVNGNIGLFPGSAVTGFPPGTVVGGAIHAADATAGTAQGDLTTAYNDAAGRTVPTIITVPDIGGQTLPAGLYKTGASSSLGITGVLTLDGGGNPAAVFIFQIASTLTTASGSQVNLINGANAANIFWQVGSSATLGTTSIFNGTILAQVSITVSTGAVLQGRALARTGAATMDSNSVVNPGPAVTSPIVPVLTAVSCPLTAATVGVGYNSLLVATGGTAPYNFFITLGSLPAGLSVNPSTGVITGTPTGTGATANFNSNATDSEAPPVTATNTCGITVTPLSGSADVSIVKTGPATIAASTGFTYNLAVANAGPGAATGVTVTDILPAGITYVSATPSQGTCVFTTVVTCSLGTMANAGAATIALVVTSPSATGPVANTATVVSTTTDPNTPNNTSTWSVTVTATNSADVSIVKSGPATVAASANFTYNLAIANAGPSAAAGVTVTDTLPAGITYVSATSSQGTCVFTTVVTCSLGTMANAGAATIALVVTSPSAAGPVANTATVASTTPDPNTPNNTSSWTVTVASAPPTTVPVLSNWGLGLLGVSLMACAMQLMRKARV